MKLLLCKLPVYPTNLSYILTHHSDIHLQLQFRYFHKASILPTSFLTSYQRLLDHLEEAGFYSSKDLNSITKTLESMRETLDRGRNTYSPALLTLLESRMKQCQFSLDKLQKGLAVLAPGLVQTHETLVSILRSTSAVNTRSKVRCLFKTEIPWSNLLNPCLLSLVFHHGSEQPSRAAEEDRKYSKRWQVCGRRRQGSGWIR